MATIRANIWVCSNGHYYGSSAFHDSDLTTIPKRPKAEDVLDHGRTGAETEARMLKKRGSRAHCQVCMTMGVPRDDALKVRREVELELP